MKLNVYVRPLMLCGFVASCAVPYVKYVTTDPGNAFAWGWGISGLALAVCSDFQWPWPWRRRS